MYLLEIVFIVIALACLVGQVVRGVQQGYLGALLLAGTSMIVLAAWFGQLRWQMAPAYLVFAISSLLFLKRSYSHVAIRSLGVTLGVLLLAGSVTLSAGLPVFTLPAPDGPHVAGSTSLSLLDESRDNAFFGAPDEKRELYVQIWYPGALNAGEPEPRRSDFYRVEVAGATHLDFTDDAVVLPILKWLRVLGPIPTGRMIEITNAVELRFFDAYLRNGPKPRFDDFPELAVESNDDAAQ